MTIDDIAEEVFRRCLTCNMHINKDAPYIVGYKDGMPAYFCKEHVDDAKQYLAYFHEFVDVKKG